MKLDTFLPEFEFNEIHRVRVNASPERVFAAIRELTVAELSPLIFAMFALRDLPARLAGRAGEAAPAQRPFIENMYADGFIPLAEVPDREIVFGLIGQFWKPIPVPGPEIAGPQEFLAYADPDFGKVAANLLVTPDAGGVVCSTETRVHVPGRSARRRFAFYWLLIRLGSGWIRLLWLRAIKRRAER
jgi:hypothetical protein